MPYSDCCCLKDLKIGGAETGIKDYQYNYLCPNFKVVVLNFKSICENKFTRLEM